MGVKQNLREGRVTESKRSTLINPCRRRSCGCDIDFMLTAGRDPGSQLTDDILFLQTLNKTVIILNGDKITAVRVNALLQDSADLTEVGAERLQQSWLVLGVVLLVSTLLGLAVSAWVFERLTGGEDAL